MQLGITIDEEFQKYFSETWIRQLVAHTLEMKEFDTEVELSLLITCDETVRDLNRRYRGIDDTTDVLSFALSEEDIMDFITPPDGVLHLGEVIVSYPQTVKQAKTVAHGVKQELALLIVHGVLHLLGYDHDEPGREKEMKEIEQKILSGIAK